MNRHGKVTAKKRATSLSHRRIEAALLWIAFAVRVTTLEAQGLWRDEVDQWRFAFQSLGELVENFTRPGWNGPLYSPLLRVWIAAAGETVFAMRFFSVLWGVLGVALAISLARRLAGRRAAILTGALVALSPYMVWYAQEIKMYTWVPMLVLLALYALDRAASGNRRIWWATVLIAATLAVYSHILAALLIPVLVLWFLLHPHRHRRAWIGGLIVLAGLTLPYLPLFLWQSDLLFQARETGYPAYTLGQMALTLLNGWSAGIHQGAWGAGWGTLIMMGVKSLPAFLGAGALTLRERWRTAARLLLWLVVPLLAIWFVSLWGPIFTDRYLIWAAPAFYLLSGVGIADLGDLWAGACRADTRRAGAPRVGAWLSWALLLPLLVIDVHGLVVQATTDVKPAFEEVVRYVKARREEGDVLLFQIPYNHYVYDFYAEVPLDPWVAAPFTNWRTPDGAYEVDATYVAEEMRHLVMGYTRVWLIYAESDLWDDRGLVKAWLDTTYPLADAYHVHGVSVYLYVRVAE